jgi:hypothetical protein
MHLIIFCHSSVKNLISDAVTAKVATGFGNIVGNKGGLGVSFTLGKTSLLFINSHLTCTCDL